MRSLDSRTGVGAPGLIRGAEPYPWRRIAAALIAVTGFVLGPCALAAEAPQRDFGSAEQAATALIAAMRSNDDQEVMRILGPRGEPLLRSGDRVADERARARLLNAYDTSHRIEQDGTARALLVVGEQQWSLPIPMVKHAERWQFDTEASVQRIIDRRVGRNELNVIEVCRQYVSAQREYASLDRLHNGPGQYAQKFESAAGKRDGLYWEAEAGEAPSPLGPLVAKARAQGYTASDQFNRPLPYHGYLYRILTRQGAHAPGGARDYVLEGRMTGGFALLAYPAKWGDSGVMTFLVNQDGIVFEKNLGPGTEQLALEITQYDPDLTWGTTR